jgi:hypothetical protein
MVVYTMDVMEVVVINHLVEDLIVSQAAAEVELFLILLKFYLLTKFHIKGVLGFWGDRKSTRLNSSH